VRKPGKLKWENGRLILEIDTTIRIPVELEPIKKLASGIQLSRRQTEVLQGVLQEWTNKEIANQINMSERTVKFHVSTLLARFRVHGRRDLITLFGKSQPRLEDADTKRSD
jgi:DNA-binding NarL/FixJ family response regulator